MTTTTINPITPAVALVGQCPRCLGYGERAYAAHAQNETCKTCKGLGSMVIFAGCEACQFTGSKRVATEYSAKGKEAVMVRCPCATRALYKAWGLPFPVSRRRAR